MILYRKRGTEIDYLVFRVKNFKFFITRTKYMSRLPRLVIWKLSKRKNIGVEKAWSFSL